MKTISQFSKIAALSLCLMIGGVSTPSAQTTSFEHPDNLTQTHRLGCVSINQLANEYTPVDLTSAIIKCAQGGEYEQAIQLFFVYSAYGYFDQSRMKDPTAKSAIGVLNASIFQLLSDRQRVGFLQAAERLQDQSGPLFQNTCAETAELGPPDYVPYNMLAHGLRAMKFVGEKAEYASRDELIENLLVVNTDKQWRKALYEVNQCPD